MTKVTGQRPDVGEPCEFEHSQQAIPNLSHTKESKGKPFGSLLPVACSALIFKVFYWIALLVSVKYWGNYEAFRNLYWPVEPRQTLASHFIPFDGAFYLSLSESGYHSGTQACAFYPLWPMTIRYVARFLHTDSIVGGLILANLFSLAGWILFYRIVCVRWGANIAKWSLAFLVCFPGSLFYQFLYSESAFFLLLMVLWWALETGRYAFAAIPAFLLPLTRPIGIFCFLPIAWYVVATSPPLLLNRWPRFKIFLVAGDASSSSGKPLQGMWLTVVPFLGWFVYLMLMFHWTNNPFEGFAAQRYFEVHAVSHLWNVPKFILAWFTPDEWHAYKGSFLDRAIFAAFLFSLPIVWKLDRKLLPWVYVLGILPAMSGFFTSYTRFACLSFPFFIALGSLSSIKQWRGVPLLLLSGFVGLHFVLLWRYVNFQWAG